MAQPEASQTLPPSAAAVARAALDADRALIELQRLQLRENELWQVRERNSMAGPGTGLGLGLAGAVILIPFGTIPLARGAARDDDEFVDADGAERFRIIGGIMLGLGVASMVTAVACGIRVRRLRPMRRAAADELRAIHVLRVRMLDALALPSEPRHAG